MADESESIIDTGTGTRLIFDVGKGHLWIMLEASAETLTDARRATESFIVAGSASDVDALIRALEKAREIFPSR